MNKIKLVIFVFFIWVVPPAFSQVEIIVDKGETTVLLGSTTCATDLKQFVVYPDSWGVSENLKWIAYPVRIPGQISASRKYVKFQGMAILGMQKGILLILKELEAFEGWKMNWFEVQKVFAISDDGQIVLASVRYTDKPSRIRSVLVRLDINAKKCSEQSSFIHDILKH